jgi:hypothetical protein
METWQLAGIASLIWLVVIYKFKAMWRQRWRRRDSITFHFWAFAFFTAVGLLFMIEPIYLAFDHLVGLANLAWLILYVALSLAIYFIASSCYLVLKQAQPRIMPWSLGLTLLFLGVVYATGIVTLPEKPEHTIPETLVEAVFMQTLYVYIGVLSAVPIVTYSRLFRQEEIVSARLRWLVAMTATAAVTTVMILKVVLTFLVYENPASPALDLIYPWITVGVLLAGILIPVTFLPNRLYIAAARPLEFMAKAKTLHELNALKRCLDRFCPPVIDDAAGWRALLMNLDYHLYRTVIGILDAKQTLAGYARITGELTVALAEVADRYGKAPREWDLQALNQAQLLHRTLQSVDDHAEFTELVRAYCRTSKAVRPQLAAMQMEANV